MPKKRFSDERIAFALRQAGGGATIVEICHNMGVAEAKFYRRKKFYAGIGFDVVHWLKQLEDGNAKMKRFVANLMLDKNMLQDVLRKKW